MKKADAMLLFKEKKDCYACAACMNICANQAITMEIDENGFTFPKVNNDLCVNCKCCLKVCPSRNEMINMNQPIKVYAAINNNQSILKASASGGVFAALALIIFEKKGAVFGCAYNDEMEPIHIGIDNLSDIKRLQGSKYVQSSINYTFSKIKKLLELGRWVLFTGTPCQVTGLKTFLGYEYPNLIAVDLICHGVPNAAFFKGYIQHLEDKLRGKIIDFKFRDKTKGWGLLGKVIYKNNEVKMEKFIPPIISSYYSYFLNGDIYRDSCYECKYATSFRQGDLTMGDFWGVNNAHPEIVTKGGVSVLLVNSIKGLELIEEISKYITLVQSSFEHICKHNGQLRQPTSKSESREAIFNKWREGKYQAVEMQYYRSNIKKIIAFRMKKLIPECIRRSVKLILFKGSKYS